LFFIIFTKDDWIEIRGEEAHRLTARYFPDQLPEEAVVTGFRTSALALRDRLDVTGVGVEAVSSELVRLIGDQIDRKLDLSKRYSAEPKGFEDELERELNALNPLNWGTWVSELGTRIASGEAVERFGARGPVGSASWLMSIWDDHDPRYRLRALLEVLPDDEEITFDLDDLIEGGWLDSSVDPRSVAHDFVAYASQGGLPPIVLTEGSSDAEVLTSALRVRRPHLADFIRFPDFSFRPEGGAAALRQTIRAFASAGIPNRVVAIFDNDAAARDVTRALDPKSLPSNLLVRHLPHLPIATSYPTLGPQGRHNMDVNGLAASIELFLGADVLAKNGVLRPIEWRGYVAGMKAYQGEVADKADIHEAYRAKVERAIADPSVIAAQDWSGIDLVLDCILGSLRDAT